MCIRDRHQALDQGADPSAAAHAARQVAGSIDDLGARGKLGSMLEKISTLLSEEDVADRVDVAVSAALVSRSPRAAVTVSYTHLDVYKRQPLI